MTEMIRFVFRCALVASLGLSTPLLGAEETEDIETPSEVGAGVRPDPSLAVAELRRQLAQLTLLGEKEVTALDVSPGSLLGVDLSDGDAIKTRIDRIDRRLEVLQHAEMQISQIDTSTSATGVPKRELRAALEYQILLRARAFLTLEETARRSYLEAFEAYRMRVREQKEAKARAKEATFEAQAADVAPAESTGGGRESKNRVDQDAQKLFGVY